MTNPTDLETRLRATLSERAAYAPPGGPLAERILAEADAPARVLRPKHGWRTWTMPLLAAAAVAAVVGVVIGVGNLHHSSSPTPATTRLSPAPTPTPKTTPTVQSSPTAHSSTPVAVLPVNTGDVTGFTALDLTFVDLKHGWALGSANCVNSTGRCTALFRTSDGKTWTSMPGAAFNVAGVKAGCATRCVQHIRFANKNVGYVYGPKALLMTTDGGATWTPQPGGALYLETVNQNVLRIVSGGSGCPGPCNVRAETSAIAGTTWTSTALPQPGSFVGSVDFSRAGSDAYVLMTRNPAGGGSDESSTLFVSTDNGATWTHRDEPCPQTDGEADSFSVTAGRDGGVGVLCLRRGAPLADSFVAVSTDAGTSFHSTPGKVGDVDAGTQPVLVGDPATELFVVGERAARSADAGASWHEVSALTGGIGFLGFESPSVGRAVTDGGRTIWTTHDGGQSWTPFRFG